jgi:hypothetical protein
MVVPEIKQLLHQYIDSADDNSVAAVYDLLKNKIDQSRFSEEDLKKFYDRQAEHLDNPAAAYSIEEAHNIVRKSRLQK